MKRALSSIICVVILTSLLAVLSGCGNPTYSGGNGPAPGAAGGNGPGGNGPGGNGPGGPGGGSGGNGPH